LRLQINDVVNNIKAAYTISLCPAKRGSGEKRVIGAGNNPEDEQRVRVGALAPLDEKAGRIAAAVGPSDLRPHNHAGAAGKHS